MAKAKEKSLTLVDHLNLQVANWTVLYTKIHNYHWYVKGHHFFSLHVEFENQYNEASVYLDEIAERILAIGGKPVATMKEAINLSSIKEGKYDIDAETMVADLSKDYQKLIKEMLAAKEQAEADDDESTADMILGIIKALQKHIWMFNAYLG